VQSAAVPVVLLLSLRRCSAGRDALYRREVTRDWKIWKPEVAWLTGYFTLAVWLSLGMVHLPR
jgi:hypothetical protein